MSASSSSLRPAWHKGSSGGRGFQPPPTVSERGDKARSGSWGSQERSNSNKFAALDDDDDVVPPNGKMDDKPNSRSEAFRSSFGRSQSTGNKPPGRSLADLAARVPEPAAGPGRRSFETRAATGGTGRFQNYRSNSEGVVGENYKPDPKVIRYTREKLLSMRPVPQDEGLPELLKEVDGLAILSKTPQDPVCWDTFDSEEIWESFRERRAAAGALKPEPSPGARVPEPVAEVRRRNAPSSGRWQRGIALPPPDEASRRKGDNAENPDELWDDPGGSTGAAADFSAFGAIPIEDDDAFDFDKMAEATRKIDEELHGSIRTESSGEDAPLFVKAVDTTRPLATAGMTITSGSGDDVNVFEDFDDPTNQPEEEETQPQPPQETPTIRGASEDPTASSRLMKMIGVEPPKPDGANGSITNPWGLGNAAAVEKSEPAPVDSIFGSIGLSLNPWGGAPAGAAPVVADVGIGLTERLEALAAEQKAREQQIELEKRAQQEAEMLRRRQQEEESQRRALAQRQAEEQVRQQQAQAAAIQQQATQRSQVELVLMERICSILENSWGRSDLVSILTTLHAEDSRVIPLLNNVDALRALIARSPQRVALRRDPSFAGDMAVLLMTNAQWQQQQQAQARLQQEELRRRRLEEEARAQAQSRANAQINPTLPWFYSDPQNNIQGPFRGEEMRQWLEAGYFKGDLPISQQPSGPFHPLSAIFPDLHMAFKVIPVDNNAQVAKDEAERIAAERRALEEEQWKKERAEEERRMAEAREAAERQRLEAERRAAAAQAESAALAMQEQAAKSSNGGNESSTQLKIMLGLSGGQTATSAVEAEIGASSAPTTTKQAADKTVPKTNKKSQGKQYEDQPVAVVRAPSPAKPTAAAWGGAANQKPKKSISEIQQEEARQAAIEAAQSGGVPRQPSSGWANVAAGTQGWSSGIVTKSAAPGPAVLGGAGLRPAQAGRAVSGGPPNPSSINRASPLSQQQRSNSNASGSTPAEEFGATLSPTLEKWCKEQMEKLTGSDDLTLIGFCMTLNDANEIRQYLQAYLGNGPKVNAFATDFINKRGLGNKQEEWETPGSAKKGRKKKPGTR